MKIRFWGVRGSCPAPSPDTVEFGGNTSCVEIQCDDGTEIIVDAGTGIRFLGLDYLRRAGATRDLHLLISHVHWDHIQGFPLFVPAFLADFRLDIYSTMNVRRWLNNQMKVPFWPVTMDVMGAKKKFHWVRGREFKIGSGVKVECLFLKHPQEVSGFRISCGGKSVIYSSDTEHETAGLNDALQKFAEGADVLLYDAQYTPEEYQQGKIGWGHSTYEEAVRLAKSAGVKQLVLFHHEPTHNDSVLRDIEQRAQALLPGTVSAREGMIIEV